MRALEIEFSELVETSRLDAYFHLSPGRRLAKYASDGVPRHEALASREVFDAEVWAPPRFKRVYAVQGEPAMPYLRPSDTLNFLPSAADFLSAERNPNVRKYQIDPGTILVTCSGRNLGPTVYVDEYLSGFLLSHDMVRIKIEDEDLRFYLLGLLGSETGQLLLRKDKSGSVIDHISADHVSSLQVPMVEEAQIAKVADLIRKAVNLREDARLSLQRLQKEYEATLPKIPNPKSTPASWTISSSELCNRIDAAPYLDSVQKVRKALLDSGGCKLADIAEALKPLGRYRTNYVDSAHGVPILSGGQLLQAKLLNPKFIARQALTEIERYRLGSGWIAYPADGRAEEALGEPVMVIKSREDWLASGHVGRLVSKIREDAGRLYLSFKTPHAQMQLKALCSGSVVDATFPEDALSIILPPLPETTGQSIENCWAKFHEAEECEEKAYAIIEEELGSIWQSS